MKMEQITKVINERPDSLEMGTPSKGGSLKVYFNANNLEESKKLVDNAIAIREYAKAQVELRFNN